MIFYLFIFTRLLQTTMFGTSYEETQHGFGGMTPVEADVLTASVGYERGLPCSIYYELYGTGPQKILFIMGFCMPRQSWEPQVEYFAEQPQYQVCVFDNRGHGDSVSSVLYTSTSMLARDTQELLDHLKWDSVHIVGLSMGGMIAQELSLLLSPQRIASLTLAVTHAGGRFAVALPVSSVPDMLRWAVARNKEEKVRALLPFCYSKKFLKKYEDTVFEWHMETYRHVHMSSVVAHMFAVTGHYITYERMERLKASSFPILIMVGSEDRMVRTQNAKMLHELLDAKLVVIEDCGHMLNLESPERFNEELAAFLNESVKNNDKQAARDDGGMWGPTT